MDQSPPEERHFQTLIAQQTPVPRDDNSHESSGEVTAIYQEEHDCGGTSGITIMRKKDHITSFQKDGPQQVSPHWSSVQTTEVRHSSSGHLLVHHFTSSCGEAVDIVRANDDEAADYARETCSREEISSNGAAGTQNNDSAVARVLLLSFVEKLRIREGLCDVQDQLQRFESIILTMCCKEDPNLYNSLIMDLQAFEDMRRRSHYEALTVVSLQAERLSHLLVKILQTKYDMKKFGELMATIVSPTSQNQSQDVLTQGSDHKRQKSFSFENHSRNFSSGNGGGLFMQSQKVSATNPFQLEQISPPTDSQSSQQQVQATEESPRSPLQLSEVQLCNEMVDRLRAENQEYEMTIVEQDRELAQLKEILRRQEKSGIVAQISQENEQLSAQLRDSNAVITRLHDQIRDLKGSGKSFQNRNEIRKDVELQMQSRELHGIRQEHTDLMAKYADALDQLKLKEQQIVAIEQNSQAKLQQAQRDADECILYFKSLALQAKGKPPILSTENDKQQVVVSPRFPASLAPSLQSISSPTEGQRRTQRARSAGRPLLGSDISFRQSDDQPSSPKQAQQQLCYLTVAIDSMTAAFQEVSTIKQGLLAQITHFRDLYCDQIKQFSVQSYDYLDKLHSHMQLHENYSCELEKQAGTVAELKAITGQQTKHIRAQHELILAQRDKIQILCEFMDKQFRRKEKDRSGLCRLALAELPLMAETLVQTHMQVTNVKQQTQVAENDLLSLRQLHEMSKSKIRMLEEQLEKSLQYSKEIEVDAQNVHTKYERLAGLVQDVWIAEVREYNQNLAASYHQPSIEQSVVAEPPMPINWLSDIRDTLRQLRESNDFQKDECFQMLNLLNESFFAGSDGQTSQLTDEEASSGDSSRGLDEVNSDEGMQLSANLGQKPKSNRRQNRYEVNSPVPVSQKSKSSNRSNRCFQKQMTEKHELLERPIRSTSADVPFRGLTSQRTPKNVRFNNQAVLASSIRSLGPKLNQLSSGGSTHRGAQGNRNELQQMLRDEITKLKRDYLVGRETIIQMQIEIKNLRRELHESSCFNEQLNLEVQESNQRESQSATQLQQVTQQLDSTQHQLSLKDHTIETLHNQIVAFEAELTELQQAMAQVASLNTQIAETCEEWEHKHNQQLKATDELRQAHAEELGEQASSFEERVRKLQAKIAQKEQKIQEILADYDQLNDFKSETELRKRTAQDQMTETDGYLLAIETENAQLRQKLVSVKKDVSAVLEQYDRQTGINKQQRKKLEKAKQTTAQLQSELDHCKKELEEACDSIREVQARSAREQAQISAHFSKELARESQVSQELQGQIEETSALADNLQAEVEGLQQSNTGLKQHNDQLAFEIERYETRVREMMQESLSDRQKLEKYKAKINNLKRTSSRLQQQQQRAYRQDQMVSRASARDFSSEKPSTECVASGGRTHSHNNCNQQQQHTLISEENRRKHSSNSRCQNNSNLGCQRPCKSPQNPFANVSNMSGGFESLRNESCLCGPSACLASQQTKPSFIQQFSNDQAFLELKWKEEATQLSKQKQRKVLKYTEDLVKSHCKQLFEQSQQQDGNCKQLSRQVHKHVREWSAEQILDCWAIEEAALIEAKAYFNKHSPVVVTCLRLLVENNLQQIRDVMNSDQSHTVLAQPQMISNSQPRLQHAPTEDSQLTSNRSQPDDRQSDLVQAYNASIQHCQQTLQSYIQMSRSLAGICFGGCILLGSSQFSSETKDQVDHAMKYLAQDCSLYESTQTERLNKVNQVSESLVSCMQQIVKSACQVFMTRSNMTQSEAHRMLESVCDHPTKSVNTVSNCGVQVNQQSDSHQLREKLLEVETRLKSKFQHVSKLESSLDKLLQNHPQQQNLQEMTQQSITSSQSQLSDTRTVMKLLNTVKRVVSRLKIELHQDYLSLGNINVGLLRTSSMSSYQTSQQLTDGGEQVRSKILAPPRLCDASNDVDLQEGLGATIEKRRSQLRANICRAIDDLGALASTLDDSKQRRGTQSQTLI